MIRIDQIKFEINDFSYEKIQNRILEKYKIPTNELIKFEIVKESIDARNKKNIMKVFSVEITLKNESRFLKKNKKMIKCEKMIYKKPKTGKINLEKPPIIIGFGPAGMFSALLLSEMGYNPIIFERGEMVSERTNSIKKFWENGILNEESNVQFGEGGAGTFSDGKLTTRIKDIRCKMILNEFVEAGAPKEILYKNKAHIGTDILKTVVVNIRKKIIKNGGEIYFNSKVKELIIKDNKICGIEINSGEKYYSENVILAIGHSARDTFEMLNESKIKIVQKPFAVGVRVEHPQKIINISQYGDDRVSKVLGSADYTLTAKATSGRAVYSFCMCPGGYVVASSSEKETIVTNGMSEYLRNGKNANSAILVSVKPEDYGSEHPLAGMYFQRNIEKKAYEVAGKNYNAPAQKMKDFLENLESNYSNEIVEPTYAPGVTFVNFKDILPRYIIDGISEGIMKFNRQIDGFYMENSILTGVETRSSSPVRIVRNRDDFESESTKGLYPCGEGAGYSGGIISSAVDGIKIGEKIIEKYSPISKNKK